MDFMFVWGWRIARERVGRVADFCPFCRELRAFGANHLFQQPHLYFVPLGGARFVAVEAQCETCGGRLVMTGYPYPTLSSDPGDDLAQLIERTNPTLRVRCAARLQLEARARAGKISEIERGHLIKEPFLAVSPWIEMDAGTTTLPIRLGIFLGVALAVPLFTLLEGTVSGALWNSLLVLTLVGGGFILYRALTRAQRFVRRNVHPLLVHALRPLNPSFAELDRALAHLGDGRQTTSRLIKTRALFADLERAEGLAFPGLHG